MKSRQIAFGKVLCASGAQGFFGEGYWFHRAYKILFRMDMSKTTFVSKTATLNPCAGNMPLNKDFSPRERFPKCIKVDFHRNAVINAVGLSNPGLPTLLETGKWQSRTEPFLISIGSTAETQNQRLEDFGRMTDILKKQQSQFSAMFGVQINFSCPNVHHTPDELIEESVKVLDIMSVLNIPMMPKYSITTSTEEVSEIIKHPECDGVCITNTIPFGWHGIEWEKVWGSHTTPLPHLNGGLSGKPLRPMVCAYIAELRDRGIRKHINGTGGILHRDDVDQYHKVGASSISVGSAAILRPWYVNKIIRRASSMSWYRTKEILP